MHRCVVEQVSFAGCSPYVTRMVIKRRVGKFHFYIRPAAHWPCGPMDKASVYGTGDCRFESYQGHFLMFLWQRLRIRLSH